MVARLLAGGFTGRAARQDKSAPLGYEIDSSSPPICTPSYRKIGQLQCHGRSLPQKRAVSVQPPRSQ